MKNITLILFMFILVSSTIVGVKISERSQEQKVILGRNLNQIKIEIIKNFDSGYRVVEIVNQHQDSQKNDEILIIMEK